MKTRTVKISELKKVAKEIQEQKKDINKKLDKFTKRIAQYGAKVARAEYRRAQYDGTKDVSVSVEKIERGYKIIAAGETVLFIEFGSGARFGYGHPYASKYNMGPSTWSLSEQGKGKWDSPNGWFYLDTTNGEIHHSYGNKPAAAMLHAEEGIINSIKKIAQEVFG